VVLKVVGKGRSSHTTACQIRQKYFVLNYCFFTSKSTVPPHRWPQNDDEIESFSTGSPPANLQNHQNQSAPRAGLVFVLCRRGFRSFFVDSCSGSYRGVGSGTYLAFLAWVSCFSLFQLGCTIGGNDGSATECPLPRIIHSRHGSRYSCRAP
jgi:hypothetical protein